MQNEPQRDRYWVVAEDKCGLLVAMMCALAGNAHLSLEGDLSRCAFPSDLGVEVSETPTLKRQTLVPQLDFAVLPLEQYTVQRILDVILPDSRFMKDIVHIQIEKNGCLEFGSYDNFHPETIVCFQGVQKGLLTELVDSGILRSCKTPRDGLRHR